MDLSPFLQAGLPAERSPPRRSAAVRAARSALASTAQPRAGLDGENGVARCRKKAIPTSSVLIDPREHQTACAIFIGERKKWTRA